jgi:ABC-2 type transport system ATP-binding protein
VLLVTHNVLEAERAVDALSVVTSGRVVASGGPAALRQSVAANLRLEVTVAPGRSAADPPNLAPRTAAGDHRVYDVTPERVADVVTWALAARDRGDIDEFAIGPATLEDIYGELTSAREVTPGA